MSSKSLIELAIISKIMMNLYLQVHSASPPAKDEVSQALTCARLQVILCRDADAAATYERYLDLIRLTMGPFGLEVHLTEQDHAEIQNGWPDGPLSNELTLEAMQVHVSLTSNKPLLMAFNTLLKNIAILTRDLSIERFLLSSDTPEVLLVRDPSRADLWMQVARRRLQSNDRTRAHQLLTRTCASGFKERVRAQELLANSVTSLYQLGANAV